MGNEIRSHRANSCRAGWAAAKSPKPWGFRPRRCNAGRPGGSAHGLIVDLKTTERLSSAIGASHGRQGAVYATAHGNFGMRFAYAKPAPAKGDGRQVQVLEMSGDDVRAHLAALRLIALSLGRFLALSHDARELAGLIVPDFDSFYWSDPSVRAAGRDVFGF